MSRKVILCHALVERQRMDGNACDFNLQTVQLNMYSLTIFKMLYALFITQSLYSYSPLAQLLRLSICHLELSNVRFHHCSAELDLPNINEFPESNTNKLSLSDFKGVGFSTEKDIPFCCSWDLSFVFKLADRADAFCWDDVLWGWILKILNSQV